MACREDMCAEHPETGGSCPETLDSTKTTYEMLGEGSRTAAANSSCIMSKPVLFQFCQSSPRPKHRHDSRTNSTYGSLACDAAAVALNTPEARSTRPTAALGHSDGDATETTFSSVLYHGAAAAAAKHTSIAVVHNKTSSRNGNRNR